MNNWKLKNLFASFVCPSPKYLILNEKRLHWASVVCGIITKWVTLILVSLILRPKYKRGDTDLTDSWATLCQEGDKSWGNKASNCSDLSPFGRRLKKGRPAPFFFYQAPHTGKQYLLTHLKLAFFPLKAIKKQTTIENYFFALCFFTRRGWNKGICKLLQIEKKKHEVLTNQELMEKKWKLPNPHLGIMYESVSMNTYWVDELSFLKTKKHAATRDRTRDLQIFSLTLSQLSYHG